MLNRVKLNKVLVVLTEVVLAGSFSILLWVTIRAVPFPPEFVPVPYVALPAILVTMVFIALMAKEYFKENA